ncbi:MAG: hypothetical protein H6807_14055 [Planctomycetes bacterium]|nr:hypothetical protein [Planctomycetota bacterium]
MDRYPVQLPPEPHLVKTLRPMSVTELAATIPNHREVVDDAGFIIPTSKLARAVIHSDHFLRLKEVRGLVRHPAYGPNWQRPLPGARTDCLLYQATRILAVSREMSHLARLLSGFHVDGEDGSVTNVLALMLGLMCTVALGPCPLGLFAATRPGEGKTTLARVIAILFGEPEPSGLRYKSDSVLEKDIGAAMMAGDHVIILDNVRKRGRIDSPLLESLVTDRHHAFRVLGTSQRVKLMNTGLIAITANNAMLHEDLASRTLTVSFRSSIAPCDRTFDFDPEEYAAEFREEILGELMGIVEDWKAAGMPEADVKFRNPRWARAIGGMLEVTGIKGFLKNYAKESQAADLRRRALFEMGRMYETERLPVGGWIAIMERVGLTMEALGIETRSQSSQAQLSALGKLMVEFSGTTELIGDDAVTLEAEDTGHARERLYRFVVERRGLPSTSIADLVELAEQRRAEAE